MSTMDKVGSRSSRLLILQRFELHLVFCSIFSVAGVCFSVFSSAGGSLPCVQAYEQYGCPKCYYVVHVAARSELRTQTNEEHGKTYFDFFIINSWKIHEKINSAFNRGTAHCV